MGSVAKVIELGDSPVPSRQQVLFGLLRSSIDFRVITTSSHRRQLAAIVIDFTDSVSLTDSWILIGLFSAQRKLRHTLPYLYRIHGGNMWMTTPSKTL